MCIVCDDSSNTHENHPDALTYEKLQEMARGAGISPATLVHHGLTPDTIERAAKVAEVSVEEVHQGLAKAQEKMNKEGTGEGPVDDSAALEEQREEQHKEAAPQHHRR